MAVVVQTVALIALFILIGAGLARTFPFNQDTRAMFISLIVNAAMPAIILSSIFNIEMSPERFKVIMLVFFVSILINLLGIGLGYLLTAFADREAKNKAELAIVSGLGNTGFIGIPLCAVLFGPEGALYAAVFDAGVDFTIWTVGVFLLQEKKSFHVRTLKEMVNMPMLAIALGLSASFFQVKPPLLLIELFNYLAALAAPLAMFYIGTIIYHLFRSGLGREIRQIWIPILIKLFCLPLLVAFLIANLAWEPLVKQVVLIQSMMPTITLASIMFAKYSANEKFGAMTTVLTTLLSLLTIPLMIYLLGWVATT